MKIGISGYFGYQNLGDEIFLNTWKQIFNEHDVFALTPYDDINTIDKIIIGGGDIIIPKFFTNAYWREEFLHKPTYVYGVGIPNNVLVDDNELIKYRQFLNRCKYVSFRDCWSYDFAIQNKLCPNPNIVEDIAWTYKFSSHMYKKFYTNSKVVGVSIRPASILSYDNVLELCKHILNNGYDILIVPLQPASNPEWNDRDINLRLLNDLRKHKSNSSINILPDNFSVDNRIKVLEVLDIYITQRMHGMLMSLRCGTPTMTIAKSNKFYRIAEKLSLDKHICSDSVEEMIETFNYTNNNSNYFSSINPKIKFIEQSSLQQLNDFKNLVINGC